MTAGYNVQGHEIEREMAYAFLIGANWVVGTPSSTTFLEPQNIASQTVFPRNEQAQKYRSRRCVKALFKET
jgi:hypothetical protein